MSTIFLARPHRPWPSPLQAIPTMHALRGQCQPPETGVGKVQFPSDLSLDIKPGEFLVSERHSGESAVVGYRYGAWPVV